MGLSLRLLLLLLLVCLSQQQQEEGCNIFEGSWVFDASYPLYDASHCPFISTGLNCQKQGRPDSVYLQYRWNPNHCLLPRFEGKELMEWYRGKKVMFVGDSLSANQWESMACMLHAAVPNYTLTSPTTLFFPEYDFTLKLLKNGFLVTMVNRTMILDTLAGSSLWKGYDVLIFNTYHWWLHSGRLKTWDRYQIGNNTLADMDLMQAYTTALTTWANWVDSNIDPARTRVFFQGISTVHYHGTDWNEPSVQDCRDRPSPLKAPLTQEANLRGTRWSGLY